MKLNGSALATVIQYGVMLVISFCVVIFNKENKKYAIKLLSRVKDLNNIKTLLFLSIPVVLDKATMAAAYIWLGKMIAPMGKTAIASLSVIKDLEKIAFLPAIAFAQVITFLVSNDFGASNYSGIKSNIKKVLFIASIFVFAFLAIIVYDPKFFIQFFDKKAAFTDFAAQIFPILSVFVFFDLIQIILSGALRGIGDVRIVMWTRIIICFGFFCPISYLIAQTPMGSPLMKFVLIYGMFYIGNGLMSLVYINKFRSYSLGNSKKLNELAR
jgi:MATE family multidrug resistance protein